VPENPRQLVRGPLTKILVSDQEHRIAQAFIGVELVAQAAIDIAAISARRPHWLA
jgi:hypothetical protein